MRYMLCVYLARLPGISEFWTFQGDIDMSRYQGLLSSFAAILGITLFLACPIFSQTTTGDITGRNGRTGAHRTGSHRYRHE